MTEVVVPVETPVTERGDEIVVETELSAPVSIDWDSLHGDEFLKTLKGAYHPTLTEFVKEFAVRVAQIKTEIDFSQDPEIIRGMMADLLALDDEELSLKALQKAYPNRDDFIGLEFTGSKNGGMWSKPLQFVTSQYGGMENVGPFPGSLKAICEYLGDNLLQYFQNDSSSFASILNTIAEDDEDYLRQLWTQYPDLFTYKDEENDFFDRTLEVLDGPILDEFALYFQDKLRELSLDGAPYFWSAATNSENASDEMIAYVAENPDVLELKTLEGISLEEYFCEILDSRAEYEKGLKELTGKTKRWKK